MAHRYWKRNEEGELVEFFPNKTTWDKNNISNYINMRTTLSGTTKMEFSTETMDESIDRMNK